MGYSPWDRRVRHDLATKQQQIVLYTQFSLLKSPVVFQAALIQAIALCSTHREEASCPWRR